MAEQQAILTRRPVGRPRKSPQAISGRRLIPMEEAADRLGLSRWTLREWVRSGKIASHKPGKNILISDAEVERIITESERPRVA